MDYKKVFDRFKDQGFFVKTGANVGLDGAVKASLNRRGNLIFNQGDVEGARRIFITTGYSDGLCRVGDYYRSKGRILDALKMYWIAPDRSKSEPIITHLAEIISSLMKEDSPDD